MTAPSGVALLPEQMCANIFAIARTQTQLRPAPNTSNLSARTKESVGPKSTPGNEYERPTNIKNHSRRDEVPLSVSRDNNFSAMHASNYTGF